MDQAVLFGEHKHLVGVVTQPAETRVPAHKVAAIMLTPGMLHSVGPFRMHVDLARWLAEHNLPSLRFDLSGIGESLGIGSTGCSIDRAAAETSAAMDMLQKELGCEKFVLFGLCSGADDSVHTALRDDRVAGFVVIDGCGYRTRRYYAHRVKSHFLPRLLSPRKWGQVATRLLGNNVEVPQTLQTGSDVREFPDRDTAACQLQRLADRGTKMHFVYTGGIAEYYNYENQFFEMLSDVQWRGTASTRFFPQIDHVALLCEDRKELISHVGEKIVECAQVCEEVLNANRILSPGVTFANVGPMSMPVQTSELP